MELQNRFSLQGKLYVAEPVRRYIRVPITVDAAGNMDAFINASHDFIIDYINCNAYTSSAQVALTAFRIGLLNDAKSPLYDELVEGGSDIVHAVAAQVVIGTPEFRDLPPLYQPLWKNVKSYFRAVHIGTFSTAYTVELLCHVRRLRPDRAAAPAAAPKPVRR